MLDKFTSRFLHLHEIDDLEQTLFVSLKMDSHYGSVAYHVKLR